MTLCSGECIYYDVADICLEICFISCSFCNMEEHKLVHNTHLRETDILIHTEISNTTLLGALVVI